MVIAVNSFKLDEKKNTEVLVPHLGYHCVMKVTAIFSLKKQPIGRNPVSCVKNLEDILLELKTDMKTTVSLFMHRRKDYIIIGGLQVP